MRSYRFIPKKVVKKKTESTHGQWAGADRGRSEPAIIPVASEATGNRQVQPTIEDESGGTGGSLDFKLKPPRGEIEIFRCPREETAPAALP